MTLKTSDLRAALARVTPIIKGRSTLPVLACVKLGNGSIEATSFDEFASASIGGNGNACCVFGDRLTKLLQFARGEESTLELKDNMLTVTCGQSVWKLATMPAGEFPDAPKDAFKRIGVNCADLAECIENVTWAADPDANVIPYAKHLLHIRLTPTEMLAEASNSKVLARCRKAAISAEADITVPSSFSGGLLTALRENGAVLSIGNNYIQVEHEGGSYACKLGEAKYPNIDPQIAAPTEPVGKVYPAITAEALTSCLAIESHAKGAFDRTHIEFGPSSATITFRTTDNHSHIASVPGEFVPLKAEINLRHWLAALKRCDLGTAELGHTSNYFVLKKGNLTVILMKFAERP